MGGSGRLPGGDPLVGVLCLAVALDDETVALLFGSIALWLLVLPVFNGLVADLSLALPTEVTGFTGELGLAARTANTAASAAVLPGVAASLSTPAVSGDRSGSGSALAVVIAA